MAIAQEWHRDRPPIVRKSSLSLVAGSYTLRCDVKQAEKCFDDFKRAMSNVEVVQLGSFFPRPFVKGIQPAYLETLDPDGVPVINTLSIQRLRINQEACRYISQEDFDDLSEDRKLRRGDVLLTMDGGTSIGKPVYFDLDEDYTVDSHIAILRPSGIEPLALVYLLASPIGQLQFRQAESGASGQTAVTEEDVRRFIFPKINSEKLTDIVSDLDNELREVMEKAATLDQRKDEAWGVFNNKLFIKE
jgi:hypothetical protein